MFATEQNALGLFGGMTLFAHSGRDAVNIVDFMPLVRKVAVEMRKPLPGNVLLEDLIQDGTVGLIRAFREHDPQKDIPFHQYATQKIRWAIQDGLRAADWAERSVRGNANKISKTSQELQVRLGRKPNYSELADALHLRVDDVAAMMGEAFGHEFVRLHDDDEHAVHDIPDSSMEPSAIVERRHAYSRAVNCLKTLSINERRAFILRVMCEMSGQQAAEEMGVSESRVSQLHKIASEKLAHCWSSPKPIVERRAHPRRPHP
ncbi:RNA polymerase sigma factor for flagellar operon FliA [Novimethylophilus kurashikiensis]|uniref:RNA polymerase sigma factor for flagellar operon FliA n=1 Tax=Novimethylophilus kurashikiensis TaxID=1825523 RepID=A0A2R5F6Z5_9PROT|nr:RNA polymerase sigma factor for flagellar operon FliA [Novimethylophilus kurashikiensis]